MEERKDRMSLFQLSEGTGALFHLKNNKMDSNEQIEFKLCEKKNISQDSLLLVFELPEEMPLGLNIGQHIAIDAVIPTLEEPEGEDVSRKYSPITFSFTKGKFEILVKVYFKNVHPSFPNGGIMSQYLHDLPLYSNIKVRGPFGRLTYLGDGNFQFIKKFKPLTYQNKKYARVGMLAGGTGITPMFQILQAADLLKDTCDFNLIYSNRTSKDILLKEELDQLFSNKNFAFKLCFTITQQETEEAWSGPTGRISKEMIEKNCPSPDEGPLILICGPSGMCSFLMQLLIGMRYPSENIFEF